MPGCPILSGRIAVYRAQAESFGGRSDGKFGVLLVEVSKSQVLTSAGDDRVGLTKALPHCCTAGPLP